MFVVSHFNFGTFREFPSLVEASAFAVKACFEATISRDGQLYGKFSPISGLWINPALRG